MGYDLLVSEGDVYATTPVVLDPRGWTDRKDEFLRGTMDGRDYCKLKQPVHGSVLIEN